MILYPSKARCREQEGEDCFLVYEVESEFFVSWEFAVEKRLSGWAHNGQTEDLIETCLDSPYRTNHS